ncbi:hypothetical protein GCM10009574_070910 [Streptomyces asiaticus]|uniref:Uncharacterized protein n=2 Tax=Streptomyces rhizosphaericus TaxID=114699 RepID=A0ABN1QGA7_9ACTN
MTKATNGSGDSLSHYLASAFTGVGSPALFPLMMGGRAGAERCAVQMTLSRRSARGDADAGFCPVYRLRSTTV